MKIFRHLLLGTALLATIHGGLIAETDHADIKAEITKRHDEAVKRLQDWIAQVSIAAEDRDIRRARSTWQSWRAMRDFNRRR